ncbi:MAG: ComEC/Rec2 family competence protein [Rhodospirillales bacterium]
MPIVFRISDAIGGALFAERDRWLLWLPVFLGAGTGLYFGLAAEPLPWIGPSVLGLAILGLFSARRRHGLLPIAIAAAAMALGFTAAAWRTFDARHTILTRQIGPTSVTGQVSRAELFTDGARLTLERVRIAGLGPGATPERVRIRLRRKTQNILAGDWVRMRARIGPPPPPVMPGAFDFQRRLYFAGIGATGFAFGAAEKIASAGDGAGPAGLSLGQRWQQMRQRLSIRIRAVIGGDAGAVAAALITGDRSAISKPVLQAFRDSGIAHLLAISGLHVGLVAGLLFFGLRAILALVPALALTYPIKKWAALFAIGGAFFYTMLAGATVPTQRAFVMIGLILIAVIFDRQGISMRLVAIAAFVILLIQPDAMLGPSFQMSFAAVIALIAPGKSGAGKWRRAPKAIGASAPCCIWPVSPSHR